MWQDTKAFFEIEKLNSRINIIQGGARAGKTVAIMGMLGDMTFDYYNSLFSVVTDSLPNLKRGAMRDLKWFLKAQKWERYFDVNKTSNVWTNILTGSELEFFSTDMLGSLGAGRDFLFVNEANRIPFETFSNLEIRTRKRIWLDFNPVNEFWAHTKLMGKGDTSFIKLTYKDNSALDAEIVKAIESRRGDGNNNWWRVYGLGEIGSLEGNIYKGWKPVNISAIKDTGRLVRYGLDFGFSNDETALVAVYDMGGDRLGFVELLYERGLLGSQYGARFDALGLDPSVLIVADSARPEIIAEINRAGYRCIGADKDKGSVLRGIDRISQREIIYNGRNLEREFLTYAWMKKKSGEIIDQPQDGNDHLLDAARYAVDQLFKPKFDF